MALVGQCERNADGADFDNPDIFNSPPLADAIGVGNVEQGCNRAATVATKQGFLFRVPIRSASLPFLRNADRLVSGSHANSAFESILIVADLLSEGALQVEKRGLGRRGSTAKDSPPLRHNPALC